MSCVSFIFLWGGLINIFVVGLILVFIAIVFFVHAVHLQFNVRKGKKSFGMPEGILLYSDLNVPATPLFSKRLQLSGKPDCIVKKENHYLPVEVKSGRGARPHFSQILQLAAYCQILEDTSGVFVPEGILIYNNLPYTIPFNPKLRYELESVMKTMRASLRSGTVRRNHNDPRRCRHCSMKHYCTEVVQEVG